jgi:hypothetical protein
VKPESVPLLPPLVQEYRNHRMTSLVDKKTGETKRGAQMMVQRELETLQQVLNYAFRRGPLPQQSGIIHTVEVDMTVPSKQTEEVKAQTAQGNLPASKPKGS